MAASDAGKLTAAGALDLIWACLRLDLHNGAPTSVQESLVRAGPEGQVHFWEVARTHGVLPHLYLQLTKLVPEQLDERALAWAKQEFDANAVRCVAYTRELLRVLTLLASKGIDATPFKGPALAVSAYGNLLARTFMDLDVAVRGKDLDPTIAALQAVGYYAPVKRTARQERRYRRLSHDYLLSSPCGRVSIELHDRFGRHGWPALTVDDLWAARVPSTLLSEPVNIFSPEDTLWLLCAHGSGHRWSRAEWLASLSYQLTNGPAFDVEKLEGRARSAGVWRATLVGAQLSESILAAPLALTNDDASGLISTIVASTMRELRTPRRSASEAASYQLRVRDSWPSRAKYIAGSVRLQHLRMDEGLPFGLEPRRPSLILKDGLQRLVWRKKDNGKP